MYTREYVIQYIQADNVMKYIYDVVPGRFLSVYHCIVDKIQNTYQIIDKISDTHVDCIIHCRCIVIVIILKKIENTVNGTDRIIDNTLVLFVYLYFSGNGVPKGDDGKEIFNMKHTER